MTNIRQKSRIIKKLNGLKFRLETNSNGDGRMDFVRGANQKTGKLSGFDLETFLSLQINSEGHVDLNMYSKPWSRFYRFSTREPVNEIQFFRHIEGYFDAMREGNRYAG